MKYTKQELKDMAEDYLLAMRSNDPRAQMLMMVMQMHTGLSPQAIQYKIEELGLWEDPDVVKTNPSESEEVKEN